MRAGDVLRWDPKDRWCKDGIAIVQERADGSLVALDTYWDGSGDSYVLRAEDLERAEVRFNLADYHELDRYEQPPVEDYAPADRQVLGTHHGYRPRRFVRIGAEPDRATKIANARRAVDAAMEDVSSAVRRHGDAYAAYAALLNEPKGGA